MTVSGFPMRGLGDPRLAVHAAGSRPAWLWTSDGTSILWVNPVGAALFKAANVADLTQHKFGPADPHRRQVRQLTARLQTDAPPRLERLRGFGAALGRLVTCACTRFTLDDGTDAILIAAAEALGRAMPLNERLQRLVEGADIPLAAFGRDGLFVAASDAARALLGFRDLSEAGLDEARDSALRDGRAKWPVGLGQLVLQRVGSGADVGLIALLEGEIAFRSPASVMETSLHPREEADDFDEDDEGEVVQSREFFEDVPAEDAQPDAKEDEAPSTAQAGFGEDLAPRQTPLRFLWEIDDQDRFILRSDELDRLIGPYAADTLKGPWQDVARAYASYGRMAAAIASREAWAGVMLEVPTDEDGEPLIAELSAIPCYDNDEFIGYRGFGTVRDLQALTDLERRRRQEADSRHTPRSLSAHSPSPASLMDFPMESTLTPLELASPTSATGPEQHVEAPLNVVPFPSADGHVPTLTPVENNAFHELARELSARLEAEPTFAARNADLVSRDVPRSVPPERRLLDILPSPVLVLCDNRVVYANAAFLALEGRETLADLQTSGVEHYAVENALRLMLDWEGRPAEGVILDVPPAPPQRIAEPAAGVADAEDLGAILDALDDAIVMVDAGGAIVACNRAAATLFAAPGDELVARQFTTLFSSDNREAIDAALNEATHAQQTLEACTSGGIERPIRLTLGRTRPDSSNFYAVVRDGKPLRAADNEIAQAKRHAERAIADKADIVARISHEMRAPLGAIIGFADVMIDQRFGPLGSERYADYLRDIRGCGESVIAIVDDLLDLSRVENGRRNLALAPQNLNDVIEQCVAAMQPQANRERIIIRSSLVHPLPPVVADGPALRQIALNLIGNSIRLANPGGQVIVSTLHADSGEVLLRVRDTGHGLNDNEVASALSPFRTATDDREGPAQIRLSLTRALAEANHARFAVRPAPYAGTMIEVAFPPASSA